MRKILFALLLLLSPIFADEIITMMTNIISLNATHSTQNTKLKDHKKAKKETLVQDKKSNFLVRQNNELVVNQTKIDAVNAR